MTSERLCFGTYDGREVRELVKQIVKNVVKIALVQTFLRPYHKADHTSQCITKNPNHSLNLIKHLQASIENRLRKDSWDEEIFKGAAICYEDTLNKGGYKNKSDDHNPNTSNQENRNENR